MGTVFAIKPLRLFTPTREHELVLRLATLYLLLFTLLLGSIFVFADDPAGIPMTGFDAFDAMYQENMSQDSLFVEDVMKPVEKVIFTLIKFEMRLVGILLLFVCVTSVAFAIWYIAKPEFADEVSEVKMRRAGGEVIPVTEVKEFFMQFLPDIKANSGIADSYEYEKPTFGLFVRDHLLKFILLFALAISLQQSVIVAFIVKAGNALAFGAEYYTNNVDFKEHVRTFTTAGSDYKPGYDDLTTEGRNKSKIYNEMYKAVKRAKPRDRTPEFLERTGTAIANKVVELEGDANVRLDYRNFIVSAEVRSYKVEPDVSPVKYTIIYDLNALGITPGDNLGEKWLYVQILQYETTVSETSYQSASNYKQAWGGFSGGVPTVLNVHSEYSGYINSQGYKFTGNATEVTVKVSLSNGKTHEGKVTGTLRDTTYTIDFKTVVTKALEGANNASVTRVELSNVSNKMEIQLIKDGANSINNIPNTAMWRPSN